MPINDLLDHSRVESGPIELLEMTFDSTEILRTLGESFAPLMSSAEQTLTVDLPNVAIPIPGDQSRLAQSISNMLSNANKYAGAGAKVTLSASSTDDLLTIQVTDNGIGMDPADAANAFDIYYRAENEITRSVSGLGLGLKIAKTIITMHGVEVDILNALGQGTTLEIRVPRHKNIASHAA